MPDSQISFTQEIGTGKTAVIRRAQADDALKIQELYFQVYRGKYPLSVVNNLEELQHALSSDNVLWMVAFVENQIVGSVIHKIDGEQRIAKSFGAVVSPSCRGHDITRLTMKYVQDQILGKDKPCDIVYATTRTESAAPQKLTEHLGYKKLGIFPNVRKVVDYETHCLAAIFDGNAFVTRKKPPVLLPELKDLYEITRSELKLSEHAKIEDYICDDVPTEPLIEFEAIHAEHFVSNRFQEGIAAKKIRKQFFPFHMPNLLLCAKDQSAELYLFHASEDNHSCLIGGDFGGHGYQTILESVCAQIKKLGIRYIEILIDAYSPQAMREALNVRFLPSAYFPCLKMAAEDEPGFKKGERIDYLVFSRSFEMLDFKDIQLEGLYKKYLRYYYAIWRRFYIEGVFEE